jgi:hypothetical protein
LYCCAMAQTSSWYLEVWIGCVHRLMQRSGSYSPFSKKKTRRFELSNTSKPLSDCTFFPWTPRLSVMTVVVWVHWKSHIKKVSWASKWKRILALVYGDDLRITDYVFCRLIHRAHIAPDQKWSLHNSNQHCSEKMPENWELKRQC